MTHSSLANFVPLSQREKVDVSAHYSLLITPRPLCPPETGGRARSAEGVDKLKVKGEN